MIVLWLEGDYLRLVLHLLPILEPYLVVPAEYR